MDLVRRLHFQSSVHLQLQSNYRVLSDQFYCCFNHGWYHKLYNLRSKLNNCSLHLFAISCMWYYSNCINFLDLDGLLLRICKLIELVEIWFHDPNNLFEWFVAKKYHIQLVIENNLGRNLFIKFIYCSSFSKPLFQYNIWGHQYSHVHEFIGLFPWQSKNRNISFLKRFRKQIVRLINYIFNLRLNHRYSTGK